MDPPNVKLWTTIYPSYLNAKLKKSEGRKIQKSKAVDDPNIMEISEVLSFFKLHHCLENKAYPRDILQRGRVKVKLFDESNKPMNPEIQNSKTYSETELLKRLAEYIPRLKSRVSKEEVKTEPKKKNKKKK